MAYHTPGQAGIRDVTVVFHVEQELDEESRKRLVREMLKVTGISSIDFDSFRPHLMFVRYSSFKTEACEVLRQIEKIGLKPKLIVGM